MKWHQKGREPWNELLLGIIVAITKIKITKIKFMAVQKHTSFLKIVQHEYDDIHYSVNSRT